MPNWCSNRATISGPAPVIQEITDILNQQDPALLAWMVRQGGLLRRADLLDPPARLVPPLQAGLGIQVAPTLLAAAR